MHVHRDYQRARDFPPERPWFNLTSPLLRIIILTLNVRDGHKGVRIRNILFYFYQLFIAANSTIQ